MKYTQIQQNTTISQPVHSRKAGSIGLIVSLTVFGALGLFIGNYLIQTNFTSPEDIKASEIRTCNQGIYDNFDSGELDTALWGHSAHYQIAQGGLVRLYDNDNWQDIITVDKFSDDFLLEANISDFTYITDGAALLVAYDETGSNKFYVGFNNNNVVASSVIGNEQVGNVSTPVRSKDFNGVKIIRQDNKAKFYYSDDRGQVLIDEFSVYSGDVMVGISTGSFQNDEYVTAKFDNFNITCPKTGFSDIVQ